MGCVHQEVPLPDGNRMSWLDIAKCIGIVAIVLGHSSTGYINNICYSFNSIIFFILSGITFCRIRGNYDGRFCFDNRGVKKFYITLFRTILIPYLVWGGISIIIYEVVEKFVTLQLNLEQNYFAVIYNIIGLIYGNSESGFFEWNRPLWFFLLYFW